MHGIGNQTLASLADQSTNSVEPPKSAGDLATFSTVIQRIDISLKQIRQVVTTFPDPFFLESTRPDPDISRWSIFAGDPAEILSIKGLNGTIQARNHPPETVALKHVWETENEPQKPTALDFLRRWLSQWQAGRHTSDVSQHIPGPFAGGAIGWVGYDFGRHLEKLPKCHTTDDDDWEDLRLGLYDTFVVYDHKISQAHVIGLSFYGGSQSLAESRVNHWVKALTDTTKTHSPRHWPGLRVEPCLSRPEYLSKISKVLDYIRAGDIFQANFTHRFQAIGQGDPLALYENLAQISPAPFAAYAQWGKKSVICSSPEWFYRVEGDRVITRPIKGTRPRGKTPAEDAANQAELLASIKDKAELTMIVDLERNDLGRVCQFGSVKVNQALTLESYAQVHHLVAEIEGRLRPEQDAVDLLAAMFPGGSITGAPKIRAMEIIEELETHSRGVYTGAIGYIGVDGRSAWNIPIRTIVRSGQVWSYNVGGGIVADSDPDEEFNETLSKAAGMKSAIETPFP